MIMNKLLLKSYTFLLLLMSKSALSAEGIEYKHFLGITLDLGLAGPWIAVGVFLFLEAILIIFRVNQGKWKHIKV